MKLSLVSVLVCIALVGCYTQIETKHEADKASSIDAVDTTSVLSDAGHIGIDTTLFDSSRVVNVDGPVTEAKAEAPKQAVNMDGLKAATFSTADTNVVIVWDCFPYRGNGRLGGLPTIRPFANLQ
jgi:hypothetical protein